MARLHLGSSHGIYKALSPQTGQFCQTQPSNSAPQEPQRHLPMAEPLCPAGQQIVLVKAFGILNPNRMIRITLHRIHHQPMMTNQMNFKEIKIAVLKIFSIFYPRFRRLLNFACFGFSSKIFSVFMSSIFSTFFISFLSFEFSFR